MTLPFTKPIAVLGLVQIAFCVIGFFGMGAMMKFFGYPNDIFPSYFSEKVLWLREWGLVLLLLPVFWTVATTWAIEKVSSESSEMAHIIFGIFLTISVGIFWAVAIISSRPRTPIFISVQI